MAFTNTVETVGDAALTRSIIDRSITELNCNITTSIRQYAFRGCSKLASVNFPSAASVALGAFWQCTALAKAEFASTVAFANNAFYGCTALTAVILRNTEQISTITGTPFAASAIASGTGYIYVPAALVDSYKASWTTYAAQIRAIEDYPGIADIYSWAGVAANIADGSYASVYKDGDTVELDLGSEGLVNMEVVGIDADDLADGSGKAPISWISKELLATKRRMNPALVTNDDGTYQEGTGSIGSWEKSELRTYLNDTIKPLIPSDVQAMIKTVTKYSCGYDTSGAKVTNMVSEDAVWIPSHREVFNNTSYETTGSGYGLLSTQINKTKPDTTLSNWWLRTGSTVANFRNISEGGGVTSKAADTEYCIALGFCT